MKAKKESTTFFAEKTGDRLFVEMEISGNPDEAISALMKSVARNEELVEHLKVSQILFKGKNMNGVVDQARDNMINAMKQEVQEFDKAFVYDEDQS